MIVTDKYVFFIKGILSQWYKSTFSNNSFVMADSYDETNKTINAIINPFGINQTYTSCEQYMMYIKALLFNDIITADRIINEHDCRKVKELGREVKNFKQDVWDKYKYSIVYQGNLLKFSQNEKLKKELFEVGYPDKTFVECNKYDSIWGIGMSIDDPNIVDESKWKGENLLGKALTEVRRYLLKN